MYSDGPRIFARVSANKYRVSYAFWLFGLEELIIRCQNAKVTKLIRALEILFASFSSNLRGNLTLNSDLKVKFWPK